MLSTIIHILAFLVVSCGQISEVPSAIGGSGTTAPPDTSSTVPLAVRVHTVWQNLAAIDARDFSQTCQTTVEDFQTVKTCNVAIPEAQLYHSSLIMEVAATSGRCDLVRFNPYSYLASLQNNFMPAWVLNGSGAQVRCSDLPIPTDCYNGPAKELLAGQFPHFGGLLYNVAQEAFSIGYTFNSPFKLYGTGYNTNRYFSNDLVDRLTTIAPNGALGGDGYVGGSMIDWGFYCYDKYYELQYGIKIIITDIDSTNNNNPTWR